MAVPHTFAGRTGEIPAQELDDDFAACDPTNTNNQDAIGAASAASGLVVSILSVPQPSPYNYQSVRSYRYRLALAAVATQAFHARILILGDSETMGLGSTVPASYTAGRAGSWPTRLAQMMEALFHERGISVQSDNFIGDGNAGTDYPSYDPRVVLGAGWTHANGTSFGGFFFNNSADTSAIVFGIGANITDSVDVYYLDSGGGVFTVDIGGSVLQTITTGGTNLVKRATVPFTSSANNIVNLKRVSGTVSIVGCDAFDSTLSTISVLNAGWSGVTSEGYSRTTDIGDPNYPGNYAAFTADLVIVMLGVNDARNGVAVATYQTNMEAIVNTNNAYSTVLLCTQVPFGVTILPLANQQEFVDAAKAVAIAKNVGLVDIFARFGSAEIGTAFNFYNADLIHPSVFGYADIAAAVYPLVTQT